MWLLIFIFLAMTVVVGWTLFGYFIFIWFVGLFRPRKRPEIPSSLPVISVMVPCHNEGKYILWKLNNLRKLDYPKDKLEVVFVDGGSSDKTVELLTSAISKDEPYRVIVCPRKGKINQINHVLPQLKGVIIVNTDVDGLLSQDALKWIAAEFDACSSVWVVGACCYPVDALKVEEYYWDAQNKARFMESDARTSSIVVGPCYAFKKDLLDAFPDDVVADDVYIAFLANTLGYRSIYSRLVTAEEVRTPASLAEFMPHKLRKSNAFLRESLRFVYRLPEMKPFCKMLLITRIAQQLILPWTMLFWILITGVLLTLFRFDIVAFGFLSILILFLFTSMVFARVNLSGKQRVHGLATIVTGYILTNLILLVTGLCYPFFQQNSSFSRLGETHKKTGPEGL